MSIAPMVCLVLGLLLDPMPQGSPPRMLLAGASDAPTFTLGELYLAQEGAAKPADDAGGLYEVVLQNQLQGKESPLNLVWTFAAGGDDGLGASLAPAEGAVRAQLNLPEGQGIVVVSIAPGGPAEQVGLKADDILLTLGGKPLDTPESLAVRLKEAGEDAVELALVRGGKPQALRVKPRYSVTFAPAEPEKPQPFIGVSTSPVDSTLRAHLTDLPADRGLIITEVVPDSPAAQVGIHQGDIILELGGQALTDFEALAAKVRSSEGEPLAAKLVRGGQPLTVDVTPVPRPHVEAEAQAQQQAETTLLLRSALATADGTANWVELTPAGNPVVNGQQSLNLFVSKLDSQLQQGQQQQQIIIQALDSLAKANAAQPADGVEKRLDELASQIKQLADAVDELRQAVRVEKEPGAKGR